MFELNRENLSLSCRQVLESNQTIIDLMNYTLIGRADLEQVARENNVRDISTELPGLIIQVYLVLVDIFDLDVRAPIDSQQRIKAESQQQLNNKVPSKTPLVISESPATEITVSCPICAKVFKSRTSLKKHAIVHRPKKPSSSLNTELVCQLCDAVFKSLKERVKHRHKEHRAMFDNLTFPCKFCQKVCASFKYLNEHIRRAHDDQTYQCEICAKILKHKSGLSDHRRREHEEKTLSCDKCDYVSNDRSILRTHVENVHAEGEPDVPCRHCSKLFLTVTKMKTHVANVHRERSFVCDQCGEKFKTANALSEHVKGVHVDEPSTCDVCGKLCQNPKKLGIHRRRHACSTDTIHDQIQFRTETSTYEDHID